MKILLWVLMCSFCSLGRAGDFVTLPYTILYDFVAQFPVAETEGEMGASVGIASIGGEVKPVLHLHPNPPGATPARITYPEIALPSPKRGEKLLLIFSIGIREGFSPQDNPIFDGCEFIVEINGKEVYRRQYKEQRWLKESIDLRDYAGKTVRISFLTLPRQNPAYDWAVWGSPQIKIEGRESKVKMKVIPYLRFSELMRREMPSRIIRREEEQNSCTVIGVMDRYLDLPCLLEEGERKAGRVSLPFPPEIVVGEGEDPENHTLIRVLNKYGIPDIQFLAFPPEVKGGVEVGVGRFLPWGNCIVAAPLSARDVREVRIFNRWGGLLGCFQPKEPIAPPFALAVGDFLPPEGDEIALASRHKEGDSLLMVIYNCQGKPLKEIRLDIPGRDKVLLVRGHRREGGDELLIVLQESKRVGIMEAFTDRIEWRDLGAVGYEDLEVYPSIFSPEELLLTGREERLSTLTFLSSQGERKVDVGRRENLFWLMGEGSGEIPAGRYVKWGIYRHIRTDAGFPFVSEPSKVENPPSNWEEAFLRRFKDLLDDYDKSPPSLWEPCFTHRWFKGVFQAWREVVDEQAGLLKYMMLTRNNNPTEYGEFGRIDFYNGTYAFGLPAIENIYILPLRLFLRELGKKFRNNPEHFIAVEPNHEHEIAVEAEGTMGDYNPKMVQGFYEYLRNLYGVRDPQSLNRIFGTQFKDYFDAPRNWDRGEWDSYSLGNPFFKEWIAYNRYVINRRLAQTFREALLAGFPPEAITSHQIPDTYAIGSLSAFSSISNRITPIDFALNAGTSYGFTRYGVWFESPHDALQDAHNAGFNMISLGEYQALTTDEETAYRQLRFIFQHGGYAVHCMHWPTEEFNRTMRYAIRKLVENEEPRPGVTGGVGCVRGVEDEGRRYLILSLGREGTGLLKSVKEDGSWEGSVYVVPFHAHVEVEKVKWQRKGNLFLMGPVDWLDSGCNLEVTFYARASLPSILTISVRRKGRDLPGLREEIKLGREWKFYRFILRVQVPVEDIEIAIEGKAEVRDIDAVLEKEMTPKLWRGILTARPHKGGIRFDIWR